METFNSAHFISRILLINVFFENRFEIILVRAIIVDITVYSNAGRTLMEESTVIITETRLKGAYIIDIERREDSRGFFARAFCQREFRAFGLNPVIAQANIASNVRRGTLRGMHFQFPPAAETKLVRCTRGAIVDIIVDLRPESPTYLQHVAVELNETNQRALYVPERFAHGYQTLVDNTDTSYQVGEFYAPEAESGLMYNDPRLGLTWPLPVSVISEKDQHFRLLNEVEPELKGRMELAGIEG
ncbi:dTDP-4-dehydrorhamnose 3,5-epimerase [Bradyrhizobium sp. USDA 313]|uniref:dTDP-4-dehydrorhamnose 3,5-epimerase n=1 Tax=Bradyrhizobium sp. USDA 313 TaxID=3156307 RepID=UPI0035129D33